MFREVHELLFEGRLNVRGELGAARQFGAFRRAVVRHRDRVLATVRHEIHQIRRQKRASRGLREHAQQRAQTLTIRHGSSGNPTRNTRLIRIQQASKVLLRPVVFGKHV